jgi:hypothetical protein
MPGLVPGIHVLRLCSEKTWMAGTIPAMTKVGYYGVKTARPTSLPFCKSVNA